MSLGLLKLINEAAKVEGEKVTLGETWKNEINNKDIESSENSNYEILPYQMETIKTTSLENLRMMNSEGLEADKVNVVNETATEDNEAVKMKTRNEELEGQSHPETDVPFVRKTIEVNGQLIEVVVPEFDSAFDAQLPDELCEASDKEQEKECNKQLKEEIEKNPELKEKFTEEQLEQIMNGDTPDGYTWHHDAEKGKMQLVDSETHAKTGHTGGKNIWGGGTENR